MYDTDGGIKLGTSNNLILSFFESFVILKNSPYLYHEN